MMMENFPQAVGATTTGVKKMIADWAKSKGLKKAHRQQVGYKNHDCDQSAVGTLEDRAQGSVCQMLTVSATVRKSTHRLTGSFRAFALYLRRV